MIGLDIDTTGWRRGCGVPGCRWMLHPDSPGCPEHRDDPTPIATTEEDIAEAKRKELMRRAGYTL